MYVLNIALDPTRRKTFNFNKWCAAYAALQRKPLLTSLAYKAFSRSAKIFFGLHINIFFIYSLPTQQDCVHPVFLLISFLSVHVNPVCWSVSIKELEKGVFWKLPTITDLSVISWANGVPIKGFRKSGTELKQSTSSVAMPRNKSFRFSDLFSEMVQLE